jgi:hypothetical protein
MKDVFKPEMNYALQPGNMGRLLYPMHHPAVLLLL